MSNVRKTTTHKLECGITDLTVDELRDFLHPLDPDAKVRITTDHADRPGELSTVRISVDVDINKEGFTNATICR